MTTMPTVMATETDAARNSAPSITRSRTCRVFFFASRALIVWSTRVFSGWVFATELIGSGPRKKDITDFSQHPLPGQKTGGAMPLLTVRNRDDLKLGFELHQLFYCQSDLVFAAELGAEHLLAGMFDVIRVSLGRQGHVLYLAHQCFRALHVELDELFHFRALQRPGIDVNEDRAGQRLVGAIDYRFERKLHRRTVLADNLCGPQLVLVFNIVGESEIAQRVDVAGYPLHQDVVVFGGGEIAAAGLGFAVDRLGKIIEGAGVGPRAKQL